MAFILEVLENDAVRSTLADHYRMSVADAVRGYADSAADEDSVTGALGQALRGEGTIRLDGQEVRWTTRYRKLRGRGPGAPEKQFGADGVFEVELQDEQGVRSRKSLPFQAKNNSAGYGSRQLREQARRLTEFPGGGLLIIYRPEGYVAVGADAVASGDVTRQSERPLAESLGGEFLECSRGSSAYFFEPKLGGALLVQGPLLTFRRWAPRHRIRTTLRM